MRFYLARKLPAGYSAFSLPFKLLLFVMIDGWFLTVGMLLESVQPFM